MSEFDSDKDYYEILGAPERASRRDLHRLYKRMARRLHPDKGGTEEEMKSLNEAYQVLKNDQTRREYDAVRVRPPRFAPLPTASPPAKDIGLLGHGLSAFFCLLVGFFLLFLVRSQWMWFLWPIAILAVFVIFCGVLMARSAMRAINSSLPFSSPLRRYALFQEAAFWFVVTISGYGVYILLTASW